MAVIRIGCVLVLACVVGFVFGGCASQARPPAAVGDVDVDPFTLRSGNAARDVGMHYDQITPKVGASIRSNPSGALIEWYNAEGTWVAIGNTPTREVVIEGTGRPELFRVTAPGYLPQIRWVAATPGARTVEVEFFLEPDGSRH
jgi:hypothetical protein